MRSLNCSQTQIAVPRWARARAPPHTRASPSHAWWTQPSKFIARRWRLSFRAKRKNRKGADDLLDRSRPSAFSNYFFSGGAARVLAMWIVFARDVLARDVLERGRDVFALV